MYFFHRELTIIPHYNCICNASRKNSPMPFLYGKHNYNNFLILPKNTTLFSRWVSGKKLSHRKDEQIHTFFVVKLYIY
jgi:hypothetical protein